MILSYSSLVELLLTLASQCRIKGQQFYAMPSTSGQGSTLYMHLLSSSTGRCYSCHIHMAFDL